MVPRLLRLKLLSSFSGLVLVSFLVLHMLGNLKYFGGQESLDSYALFLREFGKELFGKETILWVFRGLLLLALGVHIYSTLTLYQISRAASPSYLVIERKASSFAARNMLVLGILVVIFVAFHISHLTLGVVHPEGFKHLAVYNNLNLSFVRISYFLAYLIGVGAVCFHVIAGTRSLAQSLGLAGVSDKAVNLTAKILAWALFLGFMSVPSFIYISSLRYD